MYSEDFARDVRNGLSAVRKSLPSKYFYNAKGDQLFQEIMHLEEYYLTRAELSIFREKKEKLLDLIHPETTLKIVELGAGDGLKTTVLLKYFHEQQVDYSYHPIDISAAVLEVLETNVRKQVPKVKIHPIAGDYFQVLSRLKSDRSGRTVVFFLGSNIGNFQEEVTLDFLRKIRENLRTGDCLVIGFDLKKDPQRILSAYNDRSGVTRAFNLNLLERINEELGANFRLDGFEHYPVYDPSSGECKSYLVSKQAQTVWIDTLQMSVEFSAWETILTEVSRKFEQNQIARLAKNTGFRVIENVYDANKDFADSVWEVI